MKLCFILTLGQLKKSKLRLLLTLFTMMVASGLMLTMMAKYDLMVSSFNDYEEIYMGKYDYYIVAQGDSTAGMKRERGRQRGADEAIMNKVAQLENVRDAHVMTESFVAVAHGNRGENYIPMRDQIGPSQHPVMMGLDDQLPYPLLKGTWYDVNSDKALSPVCVIGSGAANRLKLSLGDSMYVHTAVSVTPLTIVGIVEQPAATPIVSASLSSPRFAPPVASFFVTRALADQLMGKKIPPQYVNIQLKNNDKAGKERFLKQISELEKNSNCNIYVCDGATILKAMQGSRTANRLKSDSYTVMSLVFVSTLFIIFTALSMGVSERIHQFAMLRTIGVSRMQISTVVLMEAVMLAIVSWLLGCVVLITYLGIEALHMDLLVNSLCLILLGSILSAMVPIYQACSTSPLEGLKIPKVDRIIKRSFSPWLLVIAGVCVFSQVIIVHVPYLHFSVRNLLYLWVGYPLMLIGFLLLIPAIVILAERYILPLIAFVLGFNPHFLKHAFSSNIMRTVGTCAVLTVGLCLYTMIQFWGYSMLVPFLPTQATPDAIAVINPTGKDAPAISINALKSIPGIDSSRFLTLAVEQLAFSPKQCQNLDSTGLAQNNMVVIGVDIEKAFVIQNPMFNLKFVQGKPLEVFQKLKTPRTCIIPDGFAKIANLNLGDRIEVVLDDKSLLSYEIAGVVEIPGWHWLSKHSGLRKKGGFTAGMVFTEFNSAKRDFKQKNPDCFWFDLVNDANAEQVEQDIQALLSQDLTAESNLQGKKNRPYVKLTTVKNISNIVQGLGDNSIKTMSELPLIILFITGVTLISTLFASIRSRMWEFGIFRTQGMTSSMLVRVLVAESLIIATIATVLSLLYGVIIARCAIDICAYAYHFGGITPPLVIPWQGLLIGFGSIYLIAVIAAIAPIVVIFRKTPLQLLQGGRVVTD